MVQSSTTTPSSSSSRTAGNNANNNPRSGFDGLPTSLGESLPRINDDPRNPTAMEANDTRSPQLQQQQQHQRPRNLQPPVDGSPMSCGYPDDSDPRHHQHRRISPQSATQISPRSGFAGRVSASAASPSSTAAATSSPVISASGVSVHQSVLMTRGRSCSPQISGGRRMFNEDQQLEEEMEEVVGG